MGQDKALRPFLGQPLIQRIIERVAPLAGEIIITTNHPEAYQFLGLPLFTDIFPERGALGGLHTALAHASQPLVAALACDLPFASPELIKFQLEIMLNEQVDVVVPGGPEGLEPLHSLYRRATCLPICEQALRNDQRKLIAWFPQVKTRILQPDELRSCNPAGLAFWNLNTPAEFARAEALARKE